MSCSSKILNLTEPLIDGYPKHAIQLSVLGQHDSALPWILSNYIQLRCPKTITDSKYSSWMDFYFIDPKYTDSLLYTEYFSRGYLLAFHDSNFIEFLIDCINSDYYIYTSVNEFYIPNTSSYQKRFFPHAILIYGYDYEKEVFNVGGFVKEDVGSKFSKFNVSFEELERAYKTLEGIDSDSYLNRFYLMKINPLRTFTFDPIHVKDLITDYLNSENTSERLRGFYNPNTDFHYGMKIYDNLKLYYSLENIEDSDIRPLHILWEHKRLMLTRIKYMLDHNYIKEDTCYENYHNVERNAAICRNIYLKYKVTDDKKMVSKLLSYLDDILKEEKTILQQLLEEMNRALSVNELYQSL